MSLFGRKSQTEEMNDQDIDIRLGLTKTEQVDSVPHAHGSFGFSKNNPIPVDDQMGQMDYLACLRCQCNEPFDFHRVGNVGRGPDGHMVDKYELMCKKAKHNYTLYLDMYHEGPSSLIPEGLSWGSPRGNGMPFYVSNFPEGLAGAFEEEVKMTEEFDGMGIVTRQFSQSVPCMHCGHHQDFVLYTMVNAQQNQNLKEKILKYQLTELTCEKCGDKTNIEYPFFYFDHKAGVFFWHTPGEDVLDPSLVDGMFSMIQSDGDDILGKYHCRIVRDCSELVDKILVFEDNFDDRIVELLKIFVLKSNNQLSGEDTRLLYYAGFSSEDSEELKFLCISQDDVDMVVLRREGYDQIYEDFIDQLPDINSLRGQYLLVDSRYVVDCLQEVKGTKSEKENNPSGRGVFSRVASLFRRN